MRQAFSAVVFLLTAALPGAAHAGPFADDLGRCAVNASTTSDRTALLRWMFVTAAANPALSDLSATTPAMRGQAIRAAAGVFNRIMLTDCRSQVVAAIRNEGSEALNAGFASLGRVASRDMMNSPAGSASLEQLVNQMDGDGMAQLGREAGVPLDPRSR